MLKRGIALILAAMLLIGMLPASAMAEDNERCRVCQPSRTVERISLGGKISIGQKFLSSGLDVASEYPNNAPSYVDTAEEKAAWIADQCRMKGITDPWHIALWLHDWLIYNANYDYTYTRYTADGVLLEGTGVCDSYARAYNLLLKQFGFESIRITSDKMNHAWILVKIDGEWCHIDVTWDDPNKGGDENHNYFGLTDDRMDQDHDWNRSDPNYPPCTSDINYYPVRMGLGFTTEQEMIDLLNQKAAAREKTIEIYYLGDDPEFDSVTAFFDWYQTAYWDYGIRGGSYSPNGNNLTLYLEYADSSGGTHTHQYYKIVTEPDCTQGGYTTYICDCGDSYVDDHVNPLDHTGGTASCIAKAICTRCGAEYGDLKADNHTGGLYVKDTKQPTCTESGYTGDTYCAGCDAKLGSGETIDPTGHLEQPMPNVPVGCTTPGKTGGKQCYVCGEVLEPQQEVPAQGHTDRNKDFYCDICYEALCTNHQEEIIPAKAAECDKTGLTEGKKCAVCGEILVLQQIIPTTAHTYSHQYDYKCDACGEERTVNMTRDMMDMYRMYDPNSGEHFYTGSVEERDFLVSEGWQYEGIGFTFPLTTGKPVHRLYDPVTGEHLYTMDEEEKAKLIAKGWNYEGVAFNSAFENEVPQYRLHNPNETRGAYHFTASIEERDYLISLGWEDQGIGWYSMGV